MLVLNEARALVVESLLTKMLINEPYSVSELEEAIAWFQRETDRVYFSLPARASFRCKRSPGFSERPIASLARLSRCGAKTWRKKL